MTTPTRSLVASPEVAALLSLVPWAAFLLALQFWPGHVTEPTRGVLEVATISLLFVALPSALPIAAARTWMTRLAAVAVVTVVAVVSAALVVTTDDAQAGLAVLWIPLVAVPLAVVLWIGRLIVERRASASAPTDQGSHPPAAPTDRLGALVIDVIVAGAVLVVPLTALSHAGQEVAAALVGAVAATSFLALPIARRGRTLGQSLVGLAVVDATTMGRVGLARAYLRSFVVVVEAVFVTTLLPVLDFVAVVASGRSLPDRMLGTSVVRTR